MALGKQRNKQKPGLYHDENLSLRQLIPQFQKSDFPGGGGGTRCVRQYGGVPL